VCLAELPALLLGDHNRFALVLADPPALFERIPCSSKSRMSACHVSPERWEHWIGRCIRQDCSMQTRPAEPEGASRAELSERIYGAAISKVCTCGSSPAWKRRRPGRQQCQRQQCQPHPLLIAAGLLRLPAGGRVCGSQVPGPLAAGRGVRGGALCADG